MDAFRKPLAVLLSTVIFSGLPFAAVSQTTIEVGTGTVTNAPNQTPSPYANTQPGSRHQLLFHASELQAAGMGPGTIGSFGFHVQQASGATFLGFSGRIGTTAVNDLTTTWETGLVQAWAGQDFTDAVGWTDHPFDAGFFWDGTSNLVIETCYTDPANSQNAVVFQTATAFTSCVSRNSPNPTICTDPGGTHFPWQQRPNVRFTWTPFEAAPVAHIGLGATYSCTGTFAFTDASANTPTSWSWDLGDGNTSMSEDTTYTYSASGTYTVTLTVTNDFGSDVAQVDVTVNLDAVPPVAACDAPSSGTVQGFGVLDVVIEGTSFPSGDAVAEGYVDNTCQAITVMQGTDLDLAVTTAGAASHAVRAWLDLDNSGTFTANELLLSGSGPTIGSSTLIGSGAVLDTPLRLRVIAAYDLVTPDPSPCGTIQFGQAEDYAIIVIANVLPPFADFTASPITSCNGVVQFTDLSLHAPTAWDWEFGDTNHSDEQNPQHTYTASGTYSVTLIAINANGQDDTLAVDLIIVDLGAQLVTASCTPQTQSYCCGYGILGFQFAGITSTSADGSEGYQDRSCGNVAQVQEGSGYAWSVTHAANTPHDTRIWIDLNNDGDLAPTELVASSLDHTSPTGTVIIPAGTVYDTPVRLRVSSDVIGEGGTACSAPLYGQVEDFSVVIAMNTNPPNTSFSVDPPVTCDGTVQFMDLSTNLPNAWLWDFGDGSTSPEQDPMHTYLNPGSYTVSLTATNAFGSDGSVLPGAVVYVPGWQCDTLQLSPANQSSTACLGVLSDNGGPNGNYTQGTSGAFTIAPAGAVHVTIDFSLFAWGGGNGNRSLAIYDGPDVTSTLIGNFFGNGLGQLPNNGVITSTGASITLRQEQQGPGGPPPNSAGFLLTWNCSLTGIDEAVLDPINNIRPQPADEEFFIDLGPGASHERTVVLRDALGRIMEQRVVSGTASTIRFDAGDLPAGLYVLQVTDMNAIWTRTLIIR